MNKARLNALIELLDDPDETVYEIVEKELLKGKNNIIPALEEKWENSFDGRCQMRIENIIQNLQFNYTAKMLKTWLKTGAKENDLLSGYLVIDRLQYPDLNTIMVQLKLEKLRKKIWLELNNSLTLLEKTTILNHFLYNINGFAINHKNIHSPQNCFLNQLLETKKANPVSMCMLYMIVARQLELPARFIDFPKNPLVAMVDHKLAQKVHGGKSRSDVLFYINPANKGAVTSIKEIEYHLKTNDFYPLENYTEPKPDIHLLEQLLETLMYSYQSVNYNDKKEKIQKLINIIHLK
ncbi:MAG: hypothetical protein CR996_01845 [Draconibacterium sp.]|nr:MAG: hypothetical protein CR996_01845 [Draconibacterium sp.]PIF06016.1 MAG: hypothetical protein CSA36_03765 [Draconibacterium sp.]